MKQHTYSTKLEWTGNLGKGTSSYRSYNRDYNIKIDGKPILEGSSDPAFRGDPQKYNPEEMLLASVSSCHMLWYFHLCAQHKIIVTGYIDEAKAVMEEKPDGSGSFSAVTLSPKITIGHESDFQKAIDLHTEAHKYCFVANSVNFPISIVPLVFT